MRSLLSPELKQACNRTHRPTKLLFGEDLMKTISDSKLEQKIMAHEIPPKPRYHRSPSQHRQQNKPFLSNCGRMSYPPHNNNRKVSKHLVAGFKGKRTPFIVISI